METSYRPALAIGWAGSLGYVHFFGDEPPRHPTSPSNVYISSVLFSCCLMWTFHDQRRCVHAWRKCVCVLVSMCMAVYVCVFVLEGEIMFDESGVCCCHHPPPCKSLCLPQLPPSHVRLSTQTCPVSSACVYPSLPCNTMCEIPPRVLT